MDEELIRLQIPDHPIGETTIRLEKDNPHKSSVPYDTLQIHDLKAIPGIQWNPHQNHWETPYNNVHELIQWADKYNHPIPDHIRTQADIETKKAQHAQNLTQATDANITIPNLKLELYPYQKAGVAYAAEKQRTFIADEMGLGKSIQALATTEYTNQYPALIICPTSLTEDWKTKIEEALPHRTIQTIEGRKTPELTETDYTIIGYPNIHAQKQHLNNQNHNTLILDESHYCKNPDAQRTKAAKHIAKNIPTTGNILLLTGTPITNMPAEYAPQLEILGNKSTTSEAAGTSTNDTAEPTETTGATGKSTAQPTTKNSSTNYKPTATSAEKNNTSSPTSHPSPTTPSTPQWTKNTAPCTTTPSTTYKNGTHNNKNKSPSTKAPTPTKHESEHTTQHKTTKTSSNSQNSEKSPPNPKYPTP